MKKRKISFPSDKVLIERINNNDPTAKNILCQKYISKCHKLAAKYYEMYPAIGNKEDFFSLAIEILGFIPSITCFKESQSEDGGITQQERITKFHREAVVCITLLVIRGKRTILVSTQTNGFLCITRGITTHTVTSHIVGFKWRLLIFIERA